jgi:hypothetical protein
MNSERSSLARIKVKFPEQLWISDIFKRFKGIRMEIINFFPYDFERSIGNAIIEIMYFDIESIIEAIRNHPSVFEFSEIEREENRVRFNVKTKDPYLLYGVIKCGVLIDFPVNVRDGYAYWRLISSRKRIDDLLTLFEKDKLTLEESEVLDKAIDSGFFEVPRKISLEELAKELGKSKSGLSVMLRKIIKKKVTFQS